MNNLLPIVVGSVLAVLGWFGTVVYDRLESHEHRITVIETHLEDRNQ